MNLKRSSAMSKSSLNYALSAVLLLAGAASALAQFGNPLAKEPEARLIAILKSDAPQKEKADACMQLARVGTAQAVPALAALLADEKLNHMARYGLETIADPAVDEALRAALATTKGRPLVGVIGSLGVRRDAQAVDPLGALLQDADADVAQAAARALGKIGNAAAAAKLRNALAGVSAANQLAFCEGLLRCAERLAAAGSRDEAAAIYGQLRGLTTALHQVRTAALRGAILSGGTQGLTVLRENLASADYLLFTAAVRTSFEIPGPDVTAILIAALGQLATDNQVVVLQALGARRDVSALSTLEAASRSGPKPVRLAAIRALAGLAQPSSVPGLIGLLDDADRDLGQAAQESLASLPGPQVDAAVMAMLQGSDPGKRLTAIDLITRRRMTAALPALLDAAGDSDAKVRAAAMKRAGELASVDQLPALLDFLMKAKSGQDVEAAEQAVSSVCTKSGNPEACVEKLAGLMDRGGLAQKGALLRILSTLGGPDALKAIRAAVADPNAEVHASAIRALGDWKTADAAPDLLALAKAASNPTDRLLCLRSYLGLARNTDLPAGQRLTLCRDVRGVIQSQDEKRLLLSALGSLQTAEAVGLIVPYLDDAEVKEEASAATVAAAEKLLRGKDSAKAAPGLVTPLQKAAQATANPDLAKRAQDLLQQAQAKTAAK
jgi:HEAT repeat protein